MAGNRRVRGSCRINMFVFCVLTLSCLFTCDGAPPPNVLKDMQREGSNIDPKFPPPAVGNMGQQNLKPVDNVLGGAAPVGGAAPRQPPAGTKRNIMLSTHPDCEDDVLRLCSANQLRKNNFAVLDCLQGDLEIQSQVSEKCQHLIYMYKKNMTKDDRFESGVGEVCKKVFDEIPECKNLPAGEGTRIPCLIEYMDNISDPNCHQFLNKMANLIFADYMMVWHFHENCDNDIKKYSCGRLPTVDENLHMQGNTILCLARKITALEPTCKKQVLRVAELQSDDYHLDRPLYYACRGAREELCENVHAGGGKVFDCLFKNKNSPKMPEKCKELLTVRQQLIAQDVKIEKTFFDACQKDILTYRCLPAGGATIDGHAMRSHVLLCLENALHTDQKLSGLCVAEMSQLRKSLMEDYQITPEIVTQCSNEIQTFCNMGVDRGGKTLHCLMEAANQRERDRKGVTKEFSAGCRAALEDLLKEADVAEDITVDAVLAEACHGVLETECKNAGQEGVINCLMEKVDSEHMTDECEDRLLEIQYFIVRDFRLDPQLYKQCHKDAVDLCHAPQNWYEDDKPTADNSPAVFSCLYRHIKDEGTAAPSSKPLSAKCEQEVKRVMRRRAKRIDLEPEIEQKCLKDLGALCSDLQHYGKGKEMQCLQDKLDDIDDDECAEAVREFTEDEDEDLDLDTVLMRSCTPMIKKFCEELLKHDAEASDVMDCLIENKNDHEMNDKCRAGIEHHQLIQMKDFRFSHKFKEACKGDVQHLCNDKKRKSDIIACLSEIVRDDILTEKPPRVSQKCRNQLRVELLQQGETVELDQDLLKSCESSIKQYCADKKKGNAEVMECLRGHQSKLTPECHKKIFQREIDEAVQGADFLLVRECKQMIKTYCRHKDPEDIFECLKKSMNNEGFDVKCRGVILRRAMEDTKDYRLNPSLAKACRLDIPKFCKEVVTSLGNEASNTEYQGKVVNCLKIHFIQKKLSRTCYDEVRMMIQDTHIDINMDPVLMHACEDQIKQYCHDAVGEAESNRLEFQPHDAGSKVQQCLEEKLQEGKIPPTSVCGREVSRIIEEALVDVNIDPQLHTVCQVDLTRWCQDVESGEGKKMSCLLTVLEDHPAKMRAKCKILLTQRKTLWEYAAKVAPAETFSELSQQVLQSPAKNYLLGVLLTVVGVIFIVGISCGRVTKRVTREQKTK